MNTKVLVVGLGGVGSEIVSGVERMAADGAGNDIRFAVMDTDVNTIGRIKRDGFRGRIIQLSDNMTVGEYLEENQEARDRWFMGDNILAAKPMTEGAGQVREVSRLAFELAIKKGKLKPLEELLSELFMMGDGESVGALRILIVSSLAGGTGSGCLLPVAMYLRQLAASRFSRRDVIVRGIFLTADCFYSILSSDFEKKSLAGNSYAAIKELDAFMKKADGYLPKRYQGLYVNYEGENALSYNYCYLFSAQDAKAQGMASFQALKNYIMECIYAQILSPMQELNNSIEDNVVKSTMTAETENAEFRRYCAAGIQVLRYPYEDIVEYLALSKSIGILSEEWMLIDEAYREEKQKQREILNQGGYAELTDIGTFAIQYISSADSTNTVASMIRHTLTRGTAGTKKDTWAAYMEELENYAGGLAGKILAECKKQYDAVSQDIRLLSNKRRRTRTAVRNLMSDFDRLFKRCEEAMDKLADASVRQCFQIQAGQRPEPYHFEYWLQEENGFVHLLAVRCFLYYVLNEMKKRLPALHGEADSGYKTLRYIQTRISLGGSLEKSMFEEDEEAEYNAAVEKELRRISERWYFNLLNGNCRRILGIYEDGLKSLELYYKNVMYERLLEVGYEYLTGVSADLAAFFDEFYYNRGVYQSRMEGLRTKFDKKGGMAVQYLCTGEEYLASLQEHVRDVNKDRETERRLSKEIFRAIKRRKGRGEIRQDMSQLYQQEIPEYWKANLKQEYGNILDVDIIQAILREGSFLRGDWQQYEYLDKMLEQAWERTVPRLLVGNGGQGQSRLFCAYHQSLQRYKGKEADIINRRLIQSGGSFSCEDSDRYTLTFYKVIYNLNAYDIEDFAVGRPEIEVWNDSGFSFTSYHEIVKKERKTKLPPHIDKNWSSIFSMPDVNGKYTDIRITRVYQMAFLFWQKELIREEIRGGKRCYSCVTEDGAISIQSTNENGKSLKQILNDLAGYYGELEDKWKEKETELEEERRKGVLTEQSDFWKDVSEREAREKSVFEFPFELLCQEPERFWDDSLVTCMMDSVMQLLWERLIWFCREDEAYSRYRTLILRHVDLQRTSVRKAAMADLDRAERKGNAWARCIREISRYLQRKRWYDIDRDLRYKTEYKYTDK